MTAKDERPAPKAPEHPWLDEEQDLLERGEDPESLVGTDPERA